MRFLFLAPLPSAFGEALHGVRVAAALLERGHTVQIAAPSIVAPTVPHGIPFIDLDAALVRLDTELEVICSREDIDVLVLVDASAVAKLCRVLRLSPQRIVDAASRVVSLDCWSLVRPPPVWDYGPTSEPLDPWLLENTPVVRPAPIARIDAPGAYAALPELAPPSNPARIRERFGLPASSSIVVWPMARWQLAESHDNAALGEIAARLPDLVAPSLASLGNDVSIVHVSPASLAPAHQIPGYRHIEPLPASEFEALLGVADVLLSFNAVGTSLTTALSAGVPTVLCAPLDAHGRTWAWPLRLEHVLGPAVRDNPFHATMALVDSVGEVGTAVRELVLDAGVRAERRAAQARYRDAIGTLPSGAERLLAAIT